MARIDRFKLDDTEMIKMKCPLCTKLCPTYNSLVGHLLLGHAEGPWSSLEEDNEWAKMMADSAEPRWVPGKQQYDK